MKILLINPIYNRLPEKSEQRENLYSLGLAVLQTEFKKNNTICDILDLNYHKDIALECSSYEELIKKFISLDCYKYIGITSFCNNFVNAILLAEEVKKQNPSAIVYLGGAHASTCAEEVVKAFRFIDFVNIGEGEKSVKYLVDYFNSNIMIDDVPNIVYYDGTRVKHTYSAPLLAKKELPTLSPQMSLIKVQKNRLFYMSADIEGGRGCPFNCIFCSTKNFWQRQCRMKPLETILKEMDQLHSECGINHFSITHDLFTAKPDFIMQFCLAMQERKYTWTCSARFDTISKPIISQMYKSGCKDIFFGIETGSQELQKVINKNLNLNKVDEIICFCVQNRYVHTISFILGFPFETPKQLDETLFLIYRYYKSHYTKIRTGILTPEVGTKVYFDYRDKMKFDKDYMENNYDYVPLVREKEVTLVQTFPDVFSHFYYLENPHFSIHGLRFVEKALRYLCINYYKTLGIALLQYGSIIKVIADIIKVPLYSMNWIEYQHGIESFDEKLKKYIYADNSLIGTFEYEELIKGLKKQAEKVGKIRTQLTLDKPYPYLEASEIPSFAEGQYYYTICAEIDPDSLHKLTLKISSIGGAFSDEG